MFYFWLVLQHSNNQYCQKWLILFSQLRCTWCAWVVQKTTLFPQTSLNRLHAICFMFIIFYLRSQFDRALTCQITTRKIRVKFSMIFFSDVQCNNSKNQSTFSFCNNFWTGLKHKQIYVLPELWIACHSSYIRYPRGCENPG